MHTIILAVCFLVIHSSINQISAAPNCDLRTIFRTPRDFDQLELIERSSFDQDKTQDIRLKEDTRPHANAQILLRIGCDNEHIKKTEEPCIPLSQLAQYDVRKEALPQYQQHSNPLHMPIPFLFPNCLYYDALGSLCSHFLPVLREVLARRALARTLQGTLSPDKAQCSHSKEVDETVKVVDEILLNAEAVDKESGCERQVEKPEEKEAEIKGQGETVVTAETNEDKPTKQEHKKAREGHPKEKRERSEKKNTKRHAQKKSNIQKIPEDGKVHLRKLLEAETNDALVPLSAVKLQESRMSVKKDDVDDLDNTDPVKEKQEEIEDANPKGLKSNDLVQDIVPNEAAEDTPLEASNSTNSSKDLEIALVPVECQTCSEKVKNLVSYPVFNKKLGDDDISDTIEVHHCGCQNASQEESNGTTINHHPFTVDIDDLSIMHGNPVTPEFSIIQDMAPKFLRNIVAAKTLAHYLPAREEPRVSYVPQPQIVSREYARVGYVPYVQNARTTDLIPHTAERCTCNHYGGCTCEHCLRNIDRGTFYEGQPRFIVVEQPHEDEVVPSFVHRPYAGVPLPGYLSRQMSRPLAIYESHPAQSPKEILVPVQMVAAQGVPAPRCGACAPYVGELNQS